MKAFLVCLAIAAVGVTALPENYGLYLQQWQQQQQQLAQQHPESMQWSQQPEQPQWGPVQQREEPQQPMPLPMPQEQQVYQNQQWQPQSPPQALEPQMYSQYQQNISPEGYKIVPGIVDSRCPRTDDAKNPIHLPVSGDCSKFMKCYGGRAYEQLCPGGLEFGVGVNRCDYPALARCSTGGW